MNRPPILFYLIISCLAPFCINSQTIEYDLDLFLTLKSPLASSVGIYASKAGESVCQLGDVNGDGIDDWVVLLQNAVDTLTGMAAENLYIYFGKEQIQSESPPDYIIATPSTLVSFSKEIAAAGDVNNDGFDDFMVGQISFDPETYDPTYYVSLFYGGPILDSEPDLLIYPNPHDLPQYFGVLSAAGDVNGDNYSDILIGAPQVIGGTDTAHAYLYFGGVNMNNVPDIVFTGAVDEQYGAEAYGSKLCAAGDMNTDGYDDFVIAANSTSAELHLGAAQPDNVKDLVFDNIPGAGISPLPAGAGDVNNDGFDDLLVGLYLAQTAHIYYGGDTLDNISDVNISGYGSYFGWDVSTAGDMNNDTFDDVAITTNINGISSLFIFFGGIEMDALADVVINEPVWGDRFGYSLSGGGDLNNDGYADVIVGAFGNFTTSWSSVDDAGHVYFIPGGQTVNDTAEIVFSGKRPGGDGFGESLDFIGDMNNDGYSDLLVGSNRVLYNNFYTSGKAYLYFMGPEADNVPDVIFPPNWTNNSIFGQLVSAAGDVNGDNLPDFLISDLHTTYFFYGKAVIDTMRDVGIQKSLHDVYSLAALGDVNNDGYDDFLVCSGQSGPKSAYLYLGKINRISSVEDQSYISSSAARFGEASSGAGDLNGDGYDDFIIGAPGINGAMVWFGDTLMAKNYDLFLTGENESEEFGMAVSGGHDINGDGFNDIVVGALNKVYLFFGGDSMDNIADKVILNDSLFSGFGIRVNTIPDINDDGYDEITVGGYQGLYLYYGGDPLDNTADFILPGNNPNITAWDTNDENFVNIAVGQLGLDRVLVYQGELNVIIDKLNSAVKNPLEPVLYQNYPNPFNPETVINYILPRADRVELSIYNSVGQKVRTLVSEKQPAGLHQVVWDAHGFASGLYIYKLETEQGYKKSRKLILLK